VAGFSDIPQGKPFRGFFARNSPGGVSKFFRFLHPELVPVVVVGREYDDLSQPLYIGQGITSAIGPQVGTFSLNSTKDTAIQRIHANANFTGGSSIADPTRACYLAQRSAGWDSFDVSGPLSSVPQVRPRLSQGRFVNGNTIMITGIASIEAPAFIQAGSLIPPLDQRWLTTPGVLPNLATNINRDVIWEFDPPLVIPAFTVFTVGHAAGNVTTGAINFTASIFFRELGDPQEVPNV